MMTVGIPQETSFRYRLYKTGQKFLVADCANEMHECMLAQISCGVCILISIKEGNRMYDVPVEINNIRAITPEELDQMTDDRKWLPIEDKKA